MIGALINVLKRIRRLAARGADGVVGLAEDAAPLATRLEVVNAHTNAVVIRQQIGLNDVAHAELPAQARQQILLRSPASAPNSPQIAHNSVCMRQQSDWRAPKRLSWPIRGERSHWAALRSKSAPTALRRSSAPSPGPKIQRTPLDAALVGVAERKRALLAVAGATHLHFDFCAHALEALPLLRETITEDQ